MDSTDEYYVRAAEKSFSPEERQSLSVDNYLDLLRARIIRLRNEDQHKPLELVGVTVSNTIITLEVNRPVLMQDMAAGLQIRLTAPAGSGQLRIDVAPASVGPVPEVTVLEDDAIEDHGRERDDPLGENHPWIS